MTNIPITDWDGFYFNPEKKKGVESAELTFFKYSNDADRGEKKDNNKNGDMFHVVLFKYDENTLGGIDFDGAFECILIDPVAYIRNMNMTLLKLYGCIVRKTTKSSEWFNRYLYDTLKNILEMKVNAAQALGIKIEPIIEEMEKNYEKSICAKR